MSCFLHDLAGILSHDLDFFLQEKQCEPFYSKFSALLTGDKPKLVDRSTGAVTFEAGQTARLKCNFLSWKPEWKMVWKVNGKVVQMRKNKRFRQRNGKSSLLRIKRVVKADNGMYECIASNDYGSVSRLLNLTVVGKFNLLPNFAALYFLNFLNKFNSHACDLRSVRRNIQRVFDKVNFYLLVYQLSS